MSAQPAIRLTETFSPSSINEIIQEAVDDAERGLPPDLRVFHELWEVYRQRQPDDIVIVTWPTDAYQAIDTKTLSTPEDTSSSQDVWEVVERIKAETPQKRLISVGEAIKLAKATYARLKEEIQEGIEAEARYWQFLDEED